MKLDLILNVGDIFVAGVGLIAAIAAFYIGFNQNKINQTLLKMQDLVELYIIADYKTVIIQVDNIDKKVVIPKMIITNIGELTIYLTERTYNGKKYPLNDTVLPPSKMNSSAIYYVELPTNDETHISFTFNFSDSLDRKWYTEGYADLHNGKWEITYQPSARVK